jgi:hypothetical protein
MSHLRIVGEYLGREVRIAGVANLDRFALDQLHDSVLLVVFGRDFVPDEKGQAFLKLLVQHQPLAITVCGIGARKAFDSLISVLADGRELKHIMTKLFEENHIESAVEDLLQSTWPSEDRFDEWKSYVALGVGNNISDIEQAIKKFCD